MQLSHPRSMSRIARLASIAALLAGSATTARAQLPTVQQVFDTYAKAVGGRDAWSKVQGRTEIGTVDVAFAGLTGSYERYNAAPNKMRMVLDLGVGKVDQGFDGKISWQSQPMQDASRMPPAQEAAIAEAAQVGAAFLDPTRFAKATVDAKEVFDGVECYKVHVVMKAGDEHNEFFEVSTGLRRGTETATPAGSQRVLYANYKEFEGKKVPTKVVQVTPQGEVVITIATVTFGAADAAKFTAPTGIK